MKRSEINKALKDLENMLKEYRYFLPKFADFTPEEWKSKGHEFDEIRDNMLGWDITDYGLGKFDEVGDFHYQQIPVPGYHLIYLLQIPHCSPADST